MKKKSTDIVYNMKFTDNPYIDLLVYYTKYMAVNCVVKNEREALQYETKLSREESNKLIAYYKGRLTDDEFDPTLYTESNNYYRKYMGLPPIPTTTDIQQYLTLHAEDGYNINKYTGEIDELSKAAWIPMDQYIPMMGDKEQFDFSGTYFHEYRNNKEVLSRLEFYGIIDQICEDYTDPMYDYIYHMGEKCIEPQVSRTAENFSLLYVPEIEFQEIQQKFIRRFEINRKYTVSTVYSEAYAFGSIHYDNFIAMFIIIQTMIDLISEVQEYIINKDVFDSRTIRYLFESYGLEYYKEIPVKYQIRIIKNVNKLLKHKSTNINIKDLIEIFDNPPLDIYTYYLMKSKIGAKEDREYYSEDEVNYPIEDFAPNPILDLYLVAAVPRISEVVGLQSIDFDVGDGGNIRTDTKYIEGTIPIMSTPSFSLMSGCGIEEDISGSGRVKLSEIHSIIYTTPSGETAYIYNPTEEKIADALNSNGVTVTSSTTSYKYLIHPIIRLRRINGELVNHEYLNGDLPTIYNYADPTKVVDNFWNRLPHLTLSADSYPEFSIKFRQFLIKKGYMLINTKGTNSNENINLLNADVDTESVYILIRISDIDAYYKINRPTEPGKRCTTTIYKNPSIELLLEEVKSDEYYNFITFNVETARFYKGLGIYNLLEIVLFELNLKETNNRIPVLPRIYMYNFDMDALIDNNDSILYNSYDIVKWINKDDVENHLTFTGPDIRYGQYIYNSLLRITRVSSKEKFKVYDNPYTQIISDSDQFILIKPIPNINAYYTDNPQTIFVIIDQWTQLLTKPPGYVLFSNCVKFYLTESSTPLIKYNRIYFSTLKEKQISTIQECEQLSPSLIAINVYSPYHSKNPNEEYTKPNLKYVTRDMVHTEKYYRNYELSFLKVPLLDDNNISEYIEDYNMRKPYDDITNQDPFWDGVSKADILTEQEKENYHELKKQEILAKDFSIERTKYISIDAVTDVTKMSNQLSYFISLLNNTNLDKSGIASITIDSLSIAPIKLNDLFTFCIAMGYLYNGVEPDIITTSMDNNMIINGFNFSKSWGDIKLLLDYTAASSGRNFVYNSDYNEENGRWDVVANGKGYMTEALSVYPFYNGYPGAFISGRYIDCGDGYGWSGLYNVMQNEEVYDNMATYSDYTYNGWNGHNYPSYLQDAIDIGAYGEDKFLTNRTHLIDTTWGTAPYADGNSHANFINPSKISREYTGIGSDKYTEEDKIKAIQDLYYTNMRLHDHLLYMMKNAPDKKTYDVYRVTYESFMQTNLNRYIYEIRDNNGYCTYKNIDYRDDMIKSNYIYKYNTSDEMFYAYYSGAVVSDEDPVASYNNGAEKAPRGRFMVNVCETYYEYLEYRNSDLYSVLMDLRYNYTDLDERKSKINSITDKIVQGLERYFDRGEWRYLYDLIPSQSLEFIQECITKMIMFLKSWKVQMLNPTRILKIDDPNGCDNYVGIYEDVYFTDKCKYYEKPSPMDFMDYTEKENFRDTCDIQEKVIFNEYNVLKSNFIIFENGSFKDNYNYNIITSTSGTWGIENGNLVNSILNQTHANEGCYISPIIDVNKLIQLGCSKLCVIVQGFGCTVESGLPNWTHATVGIQYNNIPTDRYSRGNISTFIYKNYNTSTGEGNGVFEKTKFTLDLIGKLTNNFYIMFHSYRFNISISRIWFE